MNKNFIAYKGQKLTLEWYFSTQGKSEVLEYFENLTQDRQKKLIHLFLLLGDSGKIFNKEKFLHEGDQIYALKTSDDRLLCFFFDGAKVIITNAYEKKTKKMPPREKERALKAKADYAKRIRDRNYYG